MIINDDDDYDGDDDCDDDDDEDIDDDYDDDMMILDVMWWDWLGWDGMIK